MNLGERRFRPFLEWAASKPEPLGILSWQGGVEGVAVARIIQLLGKGFGLVVGIAVAAAYLPLRWFFLRRAARWILRRWDLRTYERRSQPHSARSPRSVRPRG